MLPTQMYDPIYHEMVHFFADILFEDGNQSWFMSQKNVINFTNISLYPTIGLYFKKENNIFCCKTL